MELIKIGKQLKTCVHKKTTNKGLLLHCQSHVDARYKRFLLMTMLNRAHCLLSPPDLFAEECDNLTGIFLKLKYPENRINSTITTFIESRIKTTASWRCSTKCTCSNYSAVQGSKISRRFTKTAVRCWKEKKQRSAPSVYEQEKCQRHQRSRCQTTVSKSAMRCL